MLQSWRDMMAGDKMSLAVQVARLKKAIRDLEADLEDLEEKTS
jgi:hypothetical protein